MKELKEYVENEFNRPIKEYLMNDINDIEDYFYDSRFWIEAVSDVQIESRGSFMISIDGDNWKEVDEYKIDKGKTIYICCNESKTADMRYTGKFNIGGDIRGYLYIEYENVKNIKKFELREAFANTGVIDASKVNFSNVKEIMFSGCNSMFDHCISLIAAPELPTRFVDRSGYYQMFANCINLKKGPSTISLVALSDNVCEHMFLGCRSLIESPIIKSDEIQKDALSGMFYGCKQLSKITLLVNCNISYQKTYLWVADVASKGVFIKSAGTKITKNSGNGIPKGWEIKEV